jgi:CheY-like chemotaxis protein
MGSAEFKKLASYHPHVIIDVELEADLSNFSGSSVHVFKVLMNLVSNAAEAMPNGGKMRVQTRNCSIDKPLLDYESIKEGEYCVLSVIDSGVGLAESDRNKIFEPFFTKKKMGRSGTGLGMAVVWGTVRDHNGYINIHSKLGEGTAIDVYFPATRRSVAVRETSVDPAMIKGSGEKILVVDDIPEQLVIAKGMLTSLNYRVEIVKSGEAAIEYLKHNACDLIVLDMVMDPGMDGLDTYTEIVKHTPHQKAVVASGYSENDRVKKVLKLGAGAYIRKPYTLAKIGLAVKAELERKPENRPIPNAEKTT